jgi:calcium-dependent protein kinase
MREVETLRLLDHPNIIKIFELFEDAQAYHLVMELCTGRELLECLSDLGHFDEKTASNIFRKILSVVNHMHKYQVCHRDLKLENFVGITKENETDIKLVDFGLSRKFGSSKNMMSTIVGTPNYVAPEVLSGNYGEKCDLWSCGVILYMLLSGSPPFNGWDSMDLIESVLKSEVSFHGPKWQQISSLAKDLILKLLTRDTVQRLDAETALQHPWFLESSSFNIDIEVVQSLQNFKLQNSFQKEVLLLLSKTISYSQLKEINEVFFSLDTQKVGFLTINEIKLGLFKAGLNPVTSDLNLCIRNLDLNKDGKVNYSEFLIAALNSKFVLSEDSIQEAFAHFAQGSGKITKKELQQVLILNNSDEEAENILKELDLEHQGEISYQEFKRILLSF